MSRYREIHEELVHFGQHTLSTQHAARFADECRRGRKPERSRLRNGAFEVNDGMWLPQESFFEMARAFEQEGFFPLIGLCPLLVELFDCRIEVAVEMVNSYLRASGQGPALFHGQYPSMVSSLGMLPRDALLYSSVARRYIALWVSTVAQASEEMVGECGV